METLSEDVLIQIGLSLSLNKVLDLCESNKFLNTYLCDNDTFWQERYIQDFGHPGVHNIASWKDEYLTRINLSVWGIGLLQYLDDPNDRQFIKSPNPIPIDSPIVEMSSGLDHILFLDANHNVYSSGKGDMGRLGLGNQDNIVIPTLINGLPKIIQVSAGNQHSLVLDEDGYAWSFGFGYSGQLGSGDRSYQTFPERIDQVNINGKKSRPPKFVQVSAGYERSLFLDEDGKVWVTGRINNYNRMLLPEPIPNLSNIVQISSKVIELALDEHGDVWINDGNEWNYITDIPKIVQISAGGTSDYTGGHSHGLLLDEDGNPWYVVNRWLVHRDIDALHTLPPIVEIASGGYSDVFLDQLGNPWDMTFNHGNYFINKIDGLPPVVHLSVGDGNVLFLVENPPTVSFDKIQKLINFDRISNYYVREDLFSYEQLVNMEFIDQEGNHYLSWVGYDPNDDIIFPPS